MKNPNNTPKLEAPTNKVIVKLRPREEKVGSIVIPNEVLPDVGSLVDVGPHCKDLTKEHIGQEVQVHEKLGTHLRINGADYIFCEEKQIAGLVAS